MSQYKTGQYPETRFYLDTHQTSAIFGVFAGDAHITFMLTHEEITRLSNMLSAVVRDLTTPVDTNA